MNAQQTLHLHRTHEARERVGTRFAADATAWPTDPWLLQSGDDADAKNHPASNTRCRL
jgi:hypothetical protein